MYAETVIKLYTELESEVGDTFFMSVFDTVTQNYYTLPKFYEQYAVRCIGKFFRSMSCTNETIKMGYKLDLNANYGDYYYTTASDWPFGIDTNGSAPYFDNKDYQEDMGFL
jgi:hypothetical protein